MTPSPSAPDTVVLSMHGVQAGYRAALWPALDATVRRGELWALVGRNGSGKSTLLRCLLGLRAPWAGRIERDRGVRVAYVPQRSDEDLAVPARVIDFVRAGLDRNWSFIRPGHVRGQAAAVEDAMRITDTTKLARRRMQELSEGQRQRVLVARSMVARPDLLVLDEPTSAMDVVAERDVFELLGRLRAEQGLAVLMASHQIRVVPEYATHAIMLDAEHHAAVAGPVEEVATSDLFAARWGTSA